MVNRQYLIAELLEDLNYLFSEAVTILNKQGYTLEISTTPEAPTDHLDNPKRLVLQGERVGDDILITNYSTIFDSAFQKDREKLAVLASLRSRRASLGLDVLVF